MYGFTINNKHSSEFGLYLKTKVFPALAEKRYTEEIIPNRDSSYKFENGYEDKIIELQCTLIESNYVLRRSKIRNIVQWLDNGGNLIFDYEKDKYYIVKLYKSINLEAVLSLDIFVITFTAYPFQYSTELKKHEVHVDGYTELNILNSGTYITTPIITIDGTADSITISNSTGVFTIQNITEKVYVNCEKMICYTLDAYGKKVNKSIDFTGNYLNIPLGASQIVVDGTNLNCNVLINYKHTYL
ncbi:phage tail domain-containing protein [Abyssisolibacter fermentans]|uniref:phage tail domain-containing protein n=1 Tax=Abyssisolibacter fermentans TaxID=1766203 RepID=UPI000834FC56|nr:phage tail domain-containing protein [Abyssisolibacter fermentans]